MFKHILLLLIFLAFNGLTSAQNLTINSLWSEKQEKSIQPLGKRLIQPTVFTTLELDEVAMQTLLASAPQEGVSKISESSTILPIPLSDGTIEEFRIVEYNMMEPELQAKYPEFKTYYGRGVKNPMNRIRLDWTSAGFRAMMSLPSGTAFIDPFSQNDTKHYVSYFKKDYPAPTEVFECGVEEPEEKEISDENTAAVKALDCNFRTYRLAIATAAEYSNFFGATSTAQSNLVMAEVIASVNRVNEVYEIDFGVRLILIGNNDAIYYYNAGSDPYTNGNPSAMINEVQGNIDGIIGSANYDIGHVYGTNSGGLASLRSPCGSGKARGVTGSANPTNDPFWIDYVAHEIGHQFGGNHTQNNSCNRSSASMEPGSASTIMGYAGICAPNVQNNSDAYFHAISIAEASDFMVNGNGATCATILTSPNTAPTVAAVNNYTIPISTPFVLTAVANDADGDVLSYCWEQYDNETGITMPPASTNATGPMFRSLIPTSSPQRYFPNLNTVIANGTDQWEVLPSVTRDMDFRVTVRDNSTNLGSCTTETDMTVSSTATAGPFVVTAPTNAGEIWLEGETKTITWDVANTDIAPVNCANVDILMSYDSGQTYPTILASNVTNNGTASIVVPSGTSTTVRVMVMCSDNIFYDISNNDFEVQAGGESFTMEIVPPNVSLCQGQNATYTVNTNAIGGFSGNVTLSANNVPTGANLSFANNPVLAGNSTTITISNTAAVTPGTYTIDITGNGTPATRNNSITLTVDAVPSTVNLNTPANGELNTSSGPNLTWTAISGVDTYQVQVATDAGFASITSDQTSTTNSLSIMGLDPNTIYYWRVKALTPCESNWSTSRDFTTENCLATLQDTPTAISDSGTPTVTSIYTVSQPGTVSGLTIPNIVGTHTYVSDLTMTLTAPDGVTSVELFSGLCGNLNDFDLGFDDDAAAAVGSAACNPLGQGGTFIPTDPLSTFDGVTAAGDWTLTVADAFNQDGGQVTSWSLNICLASLLPVEWLSFDATAMQNEIILDWSTAEERNNAGFEIERRASYEDNFQYIGKKAATTESNERNNYDFVDTNAKPGITYYYRIRQYDLDGTSELSAVRSAKLESRVSNFTVYPNPAKETIFGFIDEDNSDEIRARLYDVQGKVLKELISYDNNFQIGVGDLPAGFYYLEMKTGTVNQVEKVIVE